MTDDPRVAARLARSHLDQLLAAPDAAPIAAALPADFAARAEAYVALLLEANRHLNLTRLVAPADVARLHLLDALAALPLLDAAAPRRALDLGTGGGVPGLVLALARPSTEWSLVDSVGKKTSAVQAFAAALRLPNVRAIAQRAESLGHTAEHREAYDVVTARACAALPVLAEYALPLLRPGGLVLAWKGPMAHDELAAGRAASAILGGGEPTVHETGLAALGEHRFVIVTKEMPTPDRYPRRPGVPARRPLA